MASALQRQGRHLYDIYFLLGDADVAAFVGSDEYHALILEVDQLGGEYFPRDHRSPADMRFDTSPAVNSGEELLASIAADYARSAYLFYGDYPDLDTIYERIATIKGRL